MWHAVSVFVSLCFSVSEKTLRRCDKDTPALNSRLGALTPHVGLFGTPPQNIQVTQTSVDSHTPLLTFW